MNKPFIFGKFINNKILFCKLLVIFEELENFSTNQWQGVSTRLKRDTTSDTCIYEEKNEKAFTARNISNYIINSNVDAIKDDDGRRYFILDLSNSRKGDLEYFNKIYANCMNDEVGEAFFSFLQKKERKKGGRKKINFRIFRLFSRKSTFILYFKFRIKCLKIRKSLSLGHFCVNFFSVLGAVCFSLFLVSLHLILLKKL
jgi:hypothetical protein